MDGATKDGEPEPTEGSDFDCITTNLPGRAHSRRATPPRCEFARAKRGACGASIQNPHHRGRPPPSLVGRQGIHMSRRETTFWASSVENELWNVCTLQIHTSWSALVSCFDDSSEATDTAVVSGWENTIGAGGRAWNLRDTVVHETRWDGIKGARTERRRDVVWSATPAPTAS